MSSSRKIRLQFFGDIALNGEYMNPSFHDRLRKTAQLLDDVLDRADIRFANWEAPLIGSEPVNPAKVIALYTDEQTAVNVLPLNLKAVSLANNHVFDRFISGYQNTVSFLGKSNIAVVGAGLTPEEAQRPVFLDTDRGTTAILAYVDGGTDPFDSPEQNMLVNTLDHERAVHDVKTLSSEGLVVVVSLHWGIDYMAYPSPEQRTFARRLIDVGASVVVGHHPHRIQGHEQWRNGHIFYSLGNLLCGRVRPNVSLPRITRPAMVATCEIEDGRVVQVSEAHFYSHEGALIPASVSRARKLLDRLSRPLAFSEGDYARVYRRASAFHSLVFRPLEFMRIHKYPWKVVANLRLRHLTERTGFLRRMFSSGKGLQE